MNNNTIAREMKVCITCKKELPATNEYYSYRNKKKKILLPKCKSCFKAYKAKYRLDNIDRLKEYAKVYDKQYRTKNKEKRKLQDHIRRTKKANAFSFYDKTKWEECKKAFSNCCCYCGEKKELTMEHFVPVSKGGDNTVNNILPACPHCNYSKQDSDFYEWYSKQPFYSAKRVKDILKFLKYEDNQQQLAFL